MNDKQIDRLLKMTPQEVLNHNLWIEMSIREKVYHCLKKAERCFFKFFKYSTPLVAMMMILSFSSSVDSGLNEQHIIREIITNIQTVMPAYEKAYKEISQFGGALMKEKSSLEEDRAFVYAFLITKYSKMYRIDPYLVAAVISTESEFNPNAVSSAKAKGLTQIHQKTHKLPDKVVFDPEENIKHGIRILLMHRNTNPKEFLKDYGGFVTEEKRKEEGSKYVNKVIGKQNKIKRESNRKS